MTCKGKIFLEISGRLVQVHHVVEVSGAATRDREANAEDAAMDERQTVAMLSSGATAWSSR